MTELKRAQAQAIVLAIKAATMPVLSFEGWFEVIEKMEELKKVHPEDYLITKVLVKAMCTPSSYVEETLTELD